MGEDRVIRLVGRVRPVERRIHTDAAARPAALRATDTVGKAIRVPLRTLRRPEQRGAHPVSTDRRCRLGVARRLLAKLVDEIEHPVEIAARLLSRRPQRDQRLLLTQPLRQPTFTRPRSNPRTGRIRLRPQRVHIRERFKDRVRRGHIKLLDLRLLEYRPRLRRERHAVEALRLARRPRRRLLLRTPAHRLVAERLEPRGDP